MDALERMSSLSPLAPFELARATPPVLPDALRRRLERALERVLGLTTLNTLYQQASARSERLFVDRALGVLDVDLSILGDLGSIPAAGPLIVVANHPLGGLDGLALASLLARRRPDVRLLANHLLASLPDLRPDLLLVDAFGGRHAIHRNRRSMREAIRWVCEGGCLCLFPAGVVSYLNLRRRAVVDPAWHDSLGRLVRATDASVVPCFIEGRNSAVFQMAGLLHPTLRTALLPRALIARRGTRVTLRIGAPIDAASLAADTRGVTAALRASTDALRTADLSPSCRSAAANASLDAGRALTTEVMPLATVQGLARSETFTVFWAGAQQAPRLMHEIGRARERTFRAVGEGTGRDVDLDVFDDRYLHLCIWDERAAQLVGAYRMTVVDAVRRPTPLLYTQTLFRYDRPFLGELSPALELGRAFILPEYQKQYAPLMLLWSGIGRYVARHAPVRHLFGAVSIPATYTAAALDLMIASLRRHVADRRLARLVTPRHPVNGPSSGKRVALEVPALNDLNEAVTQLDAEGKSLPVLLRQYLKLNARVIGFNVDPMFGRAVDALMIVDLPAAPMSMLRRYMGPDEMRAYLDRFRSVEGRDASRDLDRAAVA